ncbi:acyltransferase family protein [Fulvivirga sedimenti]|uniref:DUF5009 domain-containing protein n=1 Tax=Fulvivirga sedimenti TaxID=2879465 RepID=A0A9X1HUY7_9BACT|nr:DUF5009 domain-containing protein [Fulvivirga sedimenti]MCA6075450.1 DUF5009 domain-containing protein [Fulvivirga sedimenti]MCA6076627.1 DUF5009 domain-containing protein [Fulvivirga sedimenti]MCA6077755.1 DUF5009 domain-containing protein [Fulvivirga sedimenti]
MNANISTARIESIDVVRGLDMLGIILLDQFFWALYSGVDTPFTQFMAHQFDHPDWTGNTIYDIIMPLFLFTVGAVIPFSLSKRIRETNSNRDIYLKIGRRFLILFVLGWIVQGNLLELDIDRFYIFSNTLQAIAVGYVVSCLCYMHLSKKGQYAVFTFCLVAFTLILLTISVPGSEAGLLLPDENIALYFDRLVFDRFEDQTQYTWLLSSFGFVATTLSGMFAGEWIKSGMSQPKVLRNLLLAGVIGLAAGLLMGIWHPIIKKLWTSSFVLASSGVCYLILAFFYWLIDMKGIRRWAFPLKVIGMNAITAYVLSHVIRFSTIAGFILFGTEQYTGPYYGALEVFGGFLILYLILWYMYRNKTFVKV